MGASTTGASSRAKLPEPVINVTPLVDVVLVLLIIFMVVTPALQKGAALELPAVASTDDKPKSTQPFELTLAATGDTLLEHEPVADAELDARLAALHAGDPTRKLVLAVDRGLAYEHVRTAFLRLQRIGWKGVSLQVLEKERGAP